MKKEVSVAMKDVMIRLYAIGLLTLLCCFIGGGPVHGATDHTDLITTYEGSKTCSAADCHPGAAQEVMDSIHYKLMGEVQGVYNMFTNQPVEGTHGKGNRY
jgi:hypothetical protein